MDIEIFTLCDFAQDLNGKLTIVGTFDTLYATQLPANHPNCHLAARIRFLGRENGKVPFGIRITSPDGEELMKPLQAEFHLSVNPGADSVTQNICLGIGGLPIKVYGKHVITLSVRGQDLRTLPLFVAKPPQINA